MSEEQSLPFGMIARRMNSEVFRVLKKRIREQAKVKLTIDQYGLLLSINREPDDVIQKNMAEAMGKDQSAILKLTDLLEKKELVRRVPGASDRRKNYLMITKKGERVLEQYLKIELELIDEVQQGLTKREVVAFYKIMNKIKANAEKL